MLEKPLVSMLIPSFNHAQYVQQCIESVIAQDYKNIELLIIDDGSSDDSVAKIKEMTPACKDRFTRFEFRSRPNKGLTATINEALEWARGKYYAAIASDDILYPNKTSVLVEHLENEPADVAGVFSGREVIDETGTVIHTAKKSVVFYPSFNDIISLKSTICTASQLLRLNVLRNVIRSYPERLYIEDWYTWLALTNSGYRLKIVPDILVQYRYHKSNSIKNRLQMLEAQKTILSFYKKHPLYNYSMSLCYIDSAIGLSCSSKKESAICIIKAIGFDQNILFTRKFLSACVRLIVPVPLLSQGKRRFLTVKHKDIAFLLCKNMF